MSLGMIEAMILGVKGLSMLSAVGKNVIIKGVTATTSSVIGAVGSIMGNDQPGLEEVKSKLEELDLKHTVSVIEELVKEQNDLEDMKNSVKKAIIGVNMILKKIEDELNIVQEAVKYHQTKYFNYYRSFDCSCNMETIEKHKKILDIRYRQLIDLLVLYKTGSNKSKNTVKTTAEIDIC